MSTPALGGLRNLFMEERQVASWNSLDALKLTAIAIVRFIAKAAVVTFFVVIPATAVGFIGFSALQAYMGESFIINRLILQHIASGAIGYHLWGKALAVVASWCRNV